ncbi:MAG: HDOD domain-containing protein [Proteobacteria bacterium]|jgi:HD-like signal output (HDOD) protein|nr:HDOD domain-containing protein [Pseudomonadota bacterium]MBK7116262.1 HDOD domain-containing protein [Pseudomonadota bacterium]MBK9252367.1 HDOD domain-containing protein [Pseudomonadota bacterium]MCC6633071.1 HDOD domain-containing protein [Gammaproteobacteria bacterium]
MSITDEEIVRAASSLGVIAGGANTAHRILAALCDASLDARQIAEVIQREPALSVRVLKVANSAFYGSSRNVGTLDRALMLLGLDSVRGIAAAACLDRSVARRSQQAPIDPRALALHSVASAFAAEALARRSGRAAATEAFMSALLHDFGVPVQERVDSAGVTKLLEALARDPEAQVGELEAQLVQVGHGRCAEVVFENWRLPQSIVLATRYHDDPSRAPEPARDLTTLVHLGVQLALEAGFTHPLEPRLLRLPREPLLKALNLEPDAVTSIMEGLSERVLLVTESG